MKPRAQAALPLEYPETARLIALLKRYRRARDTGLVRDTERRLIQVRTDQLRRELAAPADRRRNAA